LAEEQMVLIKPRINSAWEKKQFMSLKGDRTFVSHRIQTNFRDLDILTKIFTGLPLTAVY